jgi:hypothetical protein
MAKRGKWVSLRARELAWLQRLSKCCSASGNEHAWNGEVQQIDVAWKEFACCMEKSDNLMFTNLLCKLELRLLLGTTVRAWGSAYCAEVPTGYQRTNQCRWSSRFATCASPLRLAIVNS